MIYSEREAAGPQEEEMMLAINTRDQLRIRQYSMYQVELAQGHAQFHRIHLPLRLQLLQSLLEVGPAVHLQARPVGVHLALKRPLRPLLRLYPMDLHKLTHRAFRVASHETIAIVEV